ncbi:Retrovirus-related Pol polyprotein from transposon 17.6 [Dictyocoela muelleri]|nr:Retrovirus-related Pol polyprotein from transposon 17.6 [Dictyocoela muelleri]
MIFLTSRLKMPQPYKWNEREYSYLRNIWEEIKKSPTLSYPNFSKDFYIDTDASFRAIGSIIYQERGIIALYSHKLNDTEMNYSIVEKEFFAIYKTFVRFNTILLNSNIIIRTDNKNITFQIKDPSSRIHRWMEYLNRYNITFTHIHGKNNIVADTLFRITNISAKNQQASELLEWHIEMGHPGIFRTCKSLIYSGNHYKYKYGANIIKLCMDCQRNTYSKNYLGKISVILISNQPFDVLSTDILGPFKNSEYRRIPKNLNFVILTITCIFSRTTELYALSEISSKSLISQIKFFFEKFGVPNKIL